MSVTTQTTDKQEEQNNFSDKLDIYKFIGEVKLRLRKDITADFILAKLTDKDKTGIIEMTSNAYFAKKILTTLANRSKRYVWNEKVGKYEKKPIPEDEKKYLEDLGKAIFDGYMTRIYMTVILNRNVDKNYLINVLAGYGEDDKDLDISPEEAKGVMADLLKNQEGAKQKEK